MEVKLSKRQSADNVPSQIRVHLQSWPNTASLFKKQLKGLAPIWRFQVQEMSKGQPSSNHDVVHVVNEGETLKSISKLYGVPSNAIAAANTNMVDNIDLVFRGQQLNIPSSIGETRPIHGSLDQESFISPRLIHVKNTGYLLCLVPFIALCIGCIVMPLVLDSLDHQNTTE